MAKKKATKKKVVKKNGRPPTFTQEHKEVILRLASLDYTNEQMANIIGCTTSTFYKWLVDDPKLSDALKGAKEKSDAIVEQSLFNKATGQIQTTEIISGIDPNTGNVIETTKTKTHLPDSTAMIFWLKNRQPTKWRDKREVELGTSEIKISIDSDDVNL